MRRFGRMMGAASPNHGKKTVKSGNASTKIYRNSGCRYFNCKKCTVKFQSADEAGKAGFKPCGKCKG